MVKMPKVAKTVAKLLGDKIQREGLFMALMFISITGFLINIISLITGLSISQKANFSYISIILGIGLIFESKIRTLFKRRKRIDPFTIAKLITFLVGAVIAIGGFLTLPILNIELDGTIYGVILFANILAVFVLIYEVFFIE